MTTKRREPSYQELKHRLAVAEAALQAEREGRVKQVLRAIRQINQLIIRENDPKRLLERGCTILTQTLGYYKAWIALLDEAGAVTMTAASGFDDDFEVLRSGLERGQFPTCMNRALEQEKPVVLNNPPAECPDCPLTGAYAGRAGLTGRLSFEGRVYGVLSVSIPAAYACEPEEQELELFTELAGDIAFGLWSIESEARRQSIEREYATVLATTNDAIIASDLEGKITLFNLGAEQLLECSAKEAMGTPISRFCPEERLEEQAEIVQRVRQTGSVQAYETERLTAGGRRVRVEMSVSLRTDEHDYPCGISAIMRDITERKQAEETLRDSEEKFRGIIEQSSDGIALADEQGLVVVWNNAKAQMTGLAPGETIGRPIWDVLYRMAPEESKSPALLEYLRSTVIEASRTGRAAWLNQVREQESEHPDGTRRLLQSTIFPIKTSRGFALGNFTRDVTELKRAENKLRQSEERYRLLVESIQDSVYVLDRDWRHVVVNEAAERFTGIPRARLLGAKLTELFPKIETTPFFRVFRRVMESRQPDVVANEFTFADERKGWYEVHIYPIPEGILCISRDITERKQAEDTLRFQAQLLDSVRESVVATDLEGRIIYWGKGAEALYGYAAEEVIEKSITFIVEPWQTDEEQERIRLARENGWWRGQYRRKRKDGSSFWADTCISMVAGEDGQPSGLIGIDRDITDRMQMEKALRESEQRYKDAERVAHFGSWEMDIATGKSFWSDEFFRICGYEPGSIAPSSETGMKIIHPDDRERAAQAVNRAIETGKPYNIEKRIIRPDGTTRWVHSRGEIIYDDQQQPGRLVGSFLDITERKQVEEALQVSEARFRRIFEENPLGIAIVSPENQRIVQANSRFCEMLGYTEAELRNLTVVAITYPEDMDRENRLIAQAGQDGPPRIALEKRYIKKNGDLLWVHLTVATIPDTGRGGVVALGIAEDITERKQAEEKLRESNRQLEIAVERAEEMAVKAEAANVAKSEFLANMSHEIRTPMNGVVGMTGLLLETDLSAEQHRYAETVRSSADSLLELINDLLDFSKIEAGKLDLEIVDFDLQALLDDLAATLALRAEDKGLELVCSAAPNVPPHLRGDPGRLRQILTNLTGNAIKFTPAGEVTIQVTLESETEAAVCLRFSVRDTGIGIPQDKIGLLFEKFSQVDTSTTRQYGGTGLGLAISKQLVGLMGGEIGVESEAGRGSEFWFTACLDKQPQAGKAKTARPANLDGVRVLIVDDNATNRQILTAQVTAWGMRPAAAEDGPDALQALHQALDEKEPFQVAVIDMQMPGMDGETLGRVIRTDQRLADIQLVMMTSLGSGGDPQHLAQIGFAAHLTKPVRPPDLKAALALVLAEEEETRSTRPALASPQPDRQRRPSLAGRQARLLLAEDNFTNQQVALGILNQLGLDAKTVGNGARAVDALQTDSYDLVLMDVQMPVMDGLEATRRIRHLESSHPNYGIPIIAMTAYAMQGDRERFLKAGMNDYLSKPVTPQDMAQILARWLPAGKMAGEETEAGPEAGERSPAPQAGDPALIFDRAALMERLTNDEEIVRTILAGFLVDIPRQIEALKGHLATGDEAAVTRQAHTIRGAAANVSGEIMQAVAFDMEKAGQAGDLASVESLLVALEAEFEQLRSAIRSTL